MKKILFLCMGNICRSPAAHCVFQQLINNAGLTDQYLVDSAGTIQYHEGSPPDGRMQDAMRKRKIPIIGTSRPLKYEDLAIFDLILAMDQSNLEDAKSLDPEKKWHHKLQLFTNYCRDPKLKEVPDPYYGYDDGFELVLDIIEEGCEALYQKLNGQ